MKSRSLRLAILAAVAAGSTLAAFPALADPVPGTTTADFSHGVDGWEGAANMPTSAVDTSPNGTPAMHTDATLDFTQYWNDTNAAFIGNYAQYASVTISIDVMVGHITTLTGMPVARDFALELRDYDKASTMAPYSSVWFKLGEIGDGNPSMQRFSVTFDPRTSALPAGWNAYGEYGADGMPALPAAQTFQRLLTDVDQILFTTAPPGMTSGELHYDMHVDNISISTVSAVPEADTWAMLVAGIGLVGALARRRPNRDGSVQGATMGATTGAA
jgi:hypothetical protein